MILGLITFIMMKKYKCEMEDLLPLPMVAVIEGVFDVAMVYHWIFSKILA